jgi:protein-S-isoprenylcysteine O-methyltransferase Ste14
MPHLAFKSKATRIHSSGQVWATLLGYGTFAMVLEMMLGSLPVLAGLLPIGKGWAEVYFYRNRLITQGVYGVVRHPQYAGIFLVIFGQLVHCPTIPTHCWLRPTFPWWPLLQHECRCVVSRMNAYHFARLRAQDRDGCE